MGTGLGFAYLPVSGIVSKHFTKRRSLAMGIITTGTSLGGFAFSVIASKLPSSIGFPWMVRLSAFITLACIMSANLLVTQPKETSTADEQKPANSAAIDTSSGEKEPASIEEPAEEEKEEKPRSIQQLLRDPAYLAIILSGFIVCLGLYFPM